MTPKEHLLKLLTLAVADIAPGQEEDIELERPKAAGHGDFSCNIAMRLAKALKKKPARSGPGRRRRPARLAPTG